MYSIVVPVYNSEQTLEHLYKRIVTVMKGMEKGFEIVFVEDGSTDNSWHIIQTLAENHPCISAIQLMRNYGQANATMCGLQHSKGQFLITIDDDLQNPPEEISVLMEAMERNANMDVIIGVPREKKHAVWRRFGSDFLNWISGYLFTKGQTIKLTSFRIMRRSVVDHLLSIHTPHPAPGALLCSITQRVKNVYVRHEPRAAGKSGYTLAKLYRLTLSKFMGFSTFPLRLLAIFGMIGTFSSIVLAVVYFMRYIHGGVKVAGWTTVVLLLISLSGFNFFAFGVLGEYLLRILQTVYGRPQYQIRQQIGGSDTGVFNSPGFDR